MTAVASRPLVLFVANNYFPAATTQALAVAFLATSLAFVAIGAPIHREYYTRRFSDGEPSRYQHFDVYVAGLTLLVSLGSVIVLGISLHYAQLPLVIAACVVYFLAEKLPDEILRYRLFQKAFGSWGLSVILKTVIQLVTLGVIFALTQGNVPAAAAIVALALGDVLVFGPQIPARIGRALVRLRPPSAHALARKAIQGLNDVRLYWAISVLGAAMAYLDRLIAILADPSMLPLFLLAVMCFSVVGMSVDFFYFSRRRSAFLQKQLDVESSLLDPRFLGALLGGLVAGGIACVVVLHYSKNGATFPWAAAVAIASLQAMVAATSIPFEISYWARAPRRLFLLETTFWVLVGIVVLAAFLLHLGITQVLLLAAACTVVRLIMHIGLAAQRPHASTEVAS